MIADLLNGRDTRKIANNTRIRRTEDGGCAIKLHNTDIMTEDAAGVITVNTDGWKTVTTKSRLNDYLPTGVRIDQEGGVWYWRKGLERVAPFTDGDKVTASGMILPSASFSDASKTRQLIARINSYAKKCGEAVPLPIPSGGDCWFCLMFDDGTTSNVDHLLSHMSDNDFYIVPSLVSRAMREKGCSSIVIASAFGQAGARGTDVAPSYVTRAVRSYLKKRLGLAR